MVDHIKDVPLGIQQRDEVLTVNRGAWQERGAQRDQTTDLTWLVVGVEIEVETVLAGAGLRHLLQRDVHVCVRWVLQHTPSLFGRLARDVSERITPEGIHPREVVAIDDDRPDMHGPILRVERTLQLRFAHRGTSLDPAIRGRVAELIVRASTGSLVRAQATATP